MSPAEAGLLLHGALGPRDRFEALVGNRRAALDREAVLPFLEALLRALDGGELVAQPPGEAGVALVLEQLGALVGHVLVQVGELVVAEARRQPHELLLDARASLLQQLCGTLALHALPAAAG